MTRSKLPFALPTKLPSGLVAVRKYWESLKRSGNEMPFWDDVNLSSLPNLANRLVLVDTFENPQRFRFNSVGEQIRKLYGADLKDKFVDEIDPRIPFEFFTAQASATLEAKLPTFFSYDNPIGRRTQRGYSRVLLPMWGNGRIEMILGAITNTSKI